MAVTVPSASADVALCFHNDDYYEDDDDDDGADERRKRSVDKMMEELEAKHKGSIISNKKGSSFSFPTELSCRQILDDAAMERLWQFLRDHSATVHLTALRLPHNGRLTIQSASALSSAVRAQCETLTELDLSENPGVLTKDKGKGLSLLVDALCGGGGGGNVPGELCHSSFVVVVALRTLNLSKNAIGTKGGVIGCIGRLLKYNTSVQRLSLAHNSLGKRSMDNHDWADGLRSNTVLQSLDLSYNKLGDPGVGRLMTSLSSKSSQLLELDLSFNKIGPAGAKHVSDLLGTNSTSSNGSSSSNNNRTLQKLNLSLNVIGAQGAEAFYWVVRYNHCLIDLNLSRNNIGDGVVAIAQGLQESEDTKLRCLDLSWNSLTDAGAEQLAFMLRGNAVLESLNVSSNAIGDAGMSALADALHSDLALKELDIVGNQMRDASALVHLICHGSYKLQRLAYEKNNLSPEQEARIVDAFQFRENKRTWLGKLLAGIEHKKMMSLNLQSRDYGDEELVVLSRHLAKHRPKVTTAFFYNSSITDRGVMALARDVLSNREAAQIQRLYCHGLVKLSDRGVAAIAQSLVAVVAATNQTTMDHRCPLLCLTLSGCNITPQGAKLLADAFERNSSLTRVNLERNRISDAGAKAIFAAVLNPPHPSLVALNMAHNRLSDNALLLMGPLVRIQDLQLEGNEISDAGALDIAKAVMGSTSIQWINLSGNHLSLKGIQALRLFLRNESMLECTDQRKTESEDDSTFVR